MFFDSVLIVLEYMVGEFNLFIINNVFKVILVFVIKEFCVNGLYIVIVENNIIEIGDKR